jgi:hypothetical protein
VEFGEEKAMFDTNRILGVDEAMRMRMEGE